MSAINWFILIQIFLITFVIWLAMKVERDG